MRKSWLRRLRSRTVRGAQTAQAQCPTLEPLEPRLLLSAATLDPTFGTGGIVQTDLAGGLYDDAIEVLRQEDGKIVVIGAASRESSNNFFHGVQFTVTRLNADGSLDAGFGVGGKVDPLFGEDSFIPRAAAIDDLGGIIVGGMPVGTTKDPQQGIILRRLNPDGTRDMTFGVNGEARESFGADRLQLDDLQWHDRSLWLAGSWQTFTPSRNYDVLVARFTGAGALDTNFGGGDGWLHQELGGFFDHGRAIVVDAAGVTVAAETDSLELNTRNVAAVRFDHAGNLITSYGAGGVASLFLGDRALPLTAAATADGGVIIAGMHNIAGTGTDFEVLTVKFTATGQLDTTFNGTGMNIISIGGSSERAENVAVDDLGRVWLAGQWATSFSVPSMGFAMRLNPTGELDTTFAADGIVSDISGRIDSAVLDGAGLLALSQSGSDMQLSRYDANGTLDTSFDGDGVVLTGFIGSQQQFIYDVIEQPDGKLIAVGFQLQPEGRGAVLAVRYNTDGSLDSSFGGGDGWMTVSVDGSYFGVQAALDSMGRIAIAGKREVGSGSILIRLTQDGQLDTTFAGDGVTEVDFEPPNSTGASTIVRTLDIDAQDRIVVGGSYVGVFMLARYQTNGTLDTTFGVNGNGVVTRDFSSSSITAVDMEVTDSGRIVAAATTGSVGFAVLSFTSDGRIDPTFAGGDGLVFGSFNYIGSAAAIAVDSQGRIVLGGRILPPVQSEGDRFGMMRFTAAGNIDTTFGDNGVVVSTQLPRGAGQDIAIDDADRIIMTGTFTDAASPGVAIARYLANGALDTTFDGEDGVILLQVGSSDDGWAGILDSSGRLVVGGRTRTVATYDDILLARYNIAAEANTAPAAHSQTLVLNEDATLAGQVTAEDAQGDALTFGLVDPPTHGQLSIASDGSFTYTPDADYFGSDAFTFIAGDSQLTSLPATVTLFIQSRNDAPVAHDDQFTVIHDRPTVFTTAQLTANDVDIDGDTMSAFLLMVGEGGTVTRNTQGDFTFTPLAGFTGNTFFMYSVSDGKSTGNSALVHLTVTNTPPVAGDLSFSVNEDIQLFQTITGTDAEGDPLTFTIVDGPTNGIANFNGNRFSYLGARHWSGTDTLTYRANDKAADSNVATITITVNPVNDQPNTVNDLYEMNHDTTLTVAAAQGVLANDTDVEGGPLRAVVERGPNFGTLTLNDDGSFIYTPNAGHTTSDSFTYHAWDETTRSPFVGYVTIRIINTAPVPESVTYTLDEDTPLSGQLAAFDAEGDAVTFITGVSVPGTMVVEADGSFVYTPYPNWSGTDDWFTYRVSDGLATSASARVTFVVQQVDDAPVANDDYLEIREDGGFLGLGSEWVVFNDVDAERAPLTATLVEDVKNGQLTFDAGGGFEYVPNPGFYGTDTFTYQVSDGKLTSNIATMTIKVVEFGAPSDLTASVSGSQITLNWTDNTGGYANYWRIERSGKPNRKTGAYNFEVVGYANSPNTTFTHDSSSGTWYYRVVAHQADYTSDPSQIVQVTVARTKGGGGGGKGGGGKHKHSFADSGTQDSLLTAAMIEETTTTTTISSKKGANDNASGSMIDLLALVKSGVTVTTTKR